MNKSRSTKNEESQVWKHYFPLVISILSLVVSIGSFFYSAHYATVAEQAKIKAFSLESEISLLGSEKTLNRVIINSGALPNDDRRKVFVDGAAFLRKGIQDLHKFHNNFFSEKKINSMRKSDVITFSETGRVLAKQAHDLERAVESLESRLDETLKRLSNAAST